MRNLKIALLFIFLAVFASESFAQTFGVKAGLNSSTFSVNGNDEKLYGGLDRVGGFHVGVTAEFPINENLFFQPEVLLSTKGFKSETEETLLGETYKYEEESNPSYIDILLLLKTNSDAKGAKFYVALGPYVGVGIAGNNKSSSSRIYRSTSGRWTITEDLEIEERSIEWGDDEENSDLKQFDAGISFGLGATINVFQLGVAYDLGLANISPYTDNGFKANNRVVRVSVGLVFRDNETE